MDIYPETHTLSLSTAAFTLARSSLSPSASLPPSLSLITHPWREDCVEIRLDRLDYRPGVTKSVADENHGELSDEDDDLCPVECVREFKTDEEFQRILEKAKEASSLVVVDFYRTSCGSCKYIEQGFSKLCKGSGDQEAPVIFLKHNVIDEYDEQSEVAERLRIKVTSCGTKLRAFLHESSGMSVAWSFNWIHNRCFDISSGIQLYVFHSHIEKCIREQIILVPIFWYLSRL
ncbi:PREDICTED: uncharacterized protein LOC104803677 isoform X2 [Tarenaya hassleriana]|uniref:uncharacterized protein LOC104803677 isoform X2 n=1 Tax=Tarenaya hassleriana TaxID=28532 RepID=UPI00053C9814|nr:PREDICTED: uncharacterized protein LOC104803677 isoform X2 [Tarenaya hassleriana]